MATYAVLGATGNTGVALIRNLLAADEARIHAFCRNEEKLLKLLPDLDQESRVKIFTGSISNVDVVTNVIKGTRAVFLAITTNDNVPGYRIGQDVAQTVIAACKRLKDSSPTVKLPKIALLSSASTSDHMSRDENSWVLGLVHRACANVYHDLEETEKMLRAESSWLTSIYVKPGVISVDEARGHRVSLDESNRGPISYMDLAAGIIDAVDDLGGRYDGKEVGVCNTGGNAKFPRGTPLTLICGLLRFYFPWLHPYLPTGGPA